MDDVRIELLAIVVGLFVAVVVVLVAATRWFRTPARGTALIVTGASGSRVAFTRVLVVPFVQTAEVLDIASHTIELERRGRLGLGCRDNIRADVRAVFYIRVNPTAEDVLKVAQSVGCARAGDPAALMDLFGDKFIEALRTVARQLDFEELTKRRDEFKDQVIQVLGRDLNGYVLDDLAIASIEQTPVEMLDPNDVLDAQGIRKITEITSRELLRANELRRQTQLEAQNLRVDEQERAQRSR